MSAQDALRAKGKLRAMRKRLPPFPQWLEATFEPDGALVVHYDEDGVEIGREVVPLKLEYLHAYFPPEEP